MPGPVNKFPDFVRHIVCRLKVLCPSLGKVKLAQVLARAGLHLCATTVGRMLKAKPAKPKPKIHPACKPGRANLSGPSRPDTLTTSGVWA